MKRASPLDFKVTLKLDAKTPQASSYIDVFNYQGTEVIGILNRYENAIQIYSLSEGILLKKLIFDKEGDHGVGNMAGFKWDESGWWIINRTTLFKVKDNQEVLFSHHFPQDSFPALASVLTRKPILLNGSNLSVSTTLLGSHEHPPLICFNTEKQTFEKVGAFPEIYRKGEWGAMNFDALFIGQNDEGGILMSYPASDSIFIYEGGIITSYLMKSKGFGEIQPPYDNISQVNAEDVNLRTWRFMSSPSYSTVIYDPYRKLYYRLAWHGSSEDQKQNPIHTWKAEESIIVHDQNMNFVREVLIPNSKVYHTYMMVVSEKGILIPYEDNDHEDRLSFDTFSF